jgi:hypothetical protein
MYVVVIDAVTMAPMETRLRWHRLARSGDVELAEPANP